MAAGLAISTLGFGVLAWGSGGAGLGAMVAGSVIYSLGRSPVVILATDLIVGSAPVERAGSASAISETGSELGGALGIAVLGSLGTAVYRGVMADAAPDGIPRQVTEAARSTLGGAVDAAGQLPASQGAELLGLARDAFSQAFELVAIVCAVLALAAAIATHALLKDVRPAA